MHLMLIFLCFLAISITVCSSSANHTTKQPSENEQAVLSKEVSATPTPIKQAEEEHLEKQEESINAPKNVSNDHIHARDSLDDKFSPGLTQQKFLQIDGYEIADLLNSPKFPEKPDEVNAITDINHVEDEDIATGDSEDHSQSFGERIFGYFKPPQDGKYIFKISSKATSQFSLSQTEKPNGLKVYASIQGRQLVKPNEFEKYSKQRSIPVPLQANQMYFIEVLHKVLYGTNHIQLGAIFPDGTDHTPLEGTYFFSMKDLSEGGGGGGNSDAGMNSGAGMSGMNGDSNNGDNLSQGLNNGGPSNNALKAAYDAGLRAGQQNGQHAGATAGENAGKQAGGDAGAIAGAEAGLRAAANALGISIDQLKEEKAEKDANKHCGLKVRLYADHFKCENRHGHICKYALSVNEENAIHLNPREAATTFILHKPGLNHASSTVSFELDKRRGNFLVKDGLKFVIAPFDGTRHFASSASFTLDSPVGIPSLTYAIRLYEQKDFYLCHSMGTSEINVDKISPNCAFHIVPPELDMNSDEVSCPTYCNQDDEREVNPSNVNNGKVDITPTQRIASTTETLQLLNSLAKHAVKVVSEKFGEHIQKEHDQSVYNMLHSSDVNNHVTMKNQGLHMNVHEEDTSKFYYIQIKFDNQIQSPLHGAAEVKTNIRELPYSVANGAQMKVSIKVTDNSPVTFTAHDAANNSIPLYLNGTSKVTVFPTLSVPLYPTSIIITSSLEVHKEFHGTMETDLSANHHPSYAQQPQHHGIDYVAVNSDKPHNGYAMFQEINTDQSNINSLQSSPQNSQPQTPAVSVPVQTHIPVVNIPVTYASKPTYQQTGYQKDWLPDVVEISYDEGGSRKKTITEIHMGKPKPIFTISKNNTLFPAPKDDALKSNDMLKRQKNITVRAHRKSLLLPKDSDVYVIKSLDPQSLIISDRQSELTEILDKNDNNIAHVRSDVENRKLNKNITGPSVTHFDDEFTAADSIQSHDLKNDSLSDEANIDKLVKTYRNLSMNIGDGLEDDPTFNDDTITPKPMTKPTHTPTTTTLKINEQATTPIMSNTTESMKIFDNKKSVFEISGNLKDVQDDKTTTSLKSVEEKFISNDVNNTSNNLLLFSKNKNATMLPLETGDEIFNMFQDVKPAEKLASPNMELNSFYVPSKRSGNQDKNIVQKKNLTVSDTEEVSERKTIMPEQPVETYDSLKSLVAKKRLINTIKSLEENMYRAKLKALSNFLREYTSNDLHESKRYAVWLAQHNHPKSWYYGVPVTGLKRSPIPRHQSVKQTKRINIIHEDDDLIPDNKKASYIRQPFYKQQYRGLPFHDEKRYEIPVSKRQVKNLNAMQIMRQNLKRQYLARKAKMIHDYLARKRNLIQKTSLVKRKQYSSSYTRWLPQRNYQASLKRSKVAKINWLRKNYCKCPLRCLRNRNRVNCIRLCEARCLKKFQHKIRRRRNTYDHTLVKTNDISNINHEQQNRHSNATNILNETLKSLTTKHSKVASYPPRRYSLKLFENPRIPLPFNLESPKFLRSFIPRNKKNYGRQKTEFSKGRNDRRLQNHRQNFIQYNYLRSQYPLHHSKSSLNTSNMKTFAKQLHLPHAKGGALARGIFSQFPSKGAPQWQTAHPKPHEYWKYYLNLPYLNISKLNPDFFSTYKKRLEDKYNGNWNAYKIPNQPSIYSASNNMYNINAWLRLIQAKKNFEKALARSRSDWMNYRNQNSYRMNAKRKPHFLNKYPVTKKLYTVPKESNTLINDNLKYKQMSSIAKFLIPYKPLHNIFPPLSLPKKKKVVNTIVPKSYIPPFPNDMYNKWAQSRYHPNQPYLNYWYPNSLPFMFYQSPFLYPNIMPPSFANLMKAKFLYDRALKNYFDSFKFKNARKNLAKYQMLMYKQRPNSNRGNVPQPPNDKSTLKKLLHNSSSITTDGNPMNKLKTKRIIPKVKIITDYDDIKPRKYKTVTGDRRTITHLNVNKTDQRKDIFHEKILENITAVNTSRNFHNQLNKTNVFVNNSTAEKDTSDFNETASKISDEINAISFLQDDESYVNKSQHSNMLLNNSHVGENSPIYIPKIILTGKNAPQGQTVKSLSFNKKKKDNKSLLGQEHSKHSKTKNMNEIKKLFFKPDLKIKKKSPNHKSILSSKQTNSHKNLSHKNRTALISVEYKELIKHLVKGENISDLLEKQSNHTIGIQKPERRVPDTIQSIHLPKKSQLNNHLKKFRESNQYKLALAMLSKSGIPFYVHKHQPFREYMGFRGIHPINRTEFLMKRNTTLVDLKEEFEKFINHEEDKEPGKQVDTVSNNTGNGGEGNFESNKTADTKFDNNSDDIFLSKNQTALNLSDQLKNTTDSRENQVTSNQRQTSVDDVKKPNALQEVKLEIEKEEKEREEKDKEKIDTEASILKKIKALAFSHKFSRQKNLSKNVNEKKPQEVLEAVSKSPAVDVKYQLTISHENKTADATIKDFHPKKKENNDLNVESKPLNVQSNKPHKTQPLKQKSGEEPQEAISIPHEIEALYSDRLENTSPGFSLTGNKNENFEFDGIKSSKNRDSMYGDWFDAGFKPDVITKQDLKMSKSKYMTRLLDKQKEMKSGKITDNAKFLFYGPTVKQVEDKINYIVKNEESDEQRELQNLIKESIGTGNLNEVEQLALDKEETKNFASKGDDEYKTGVNLTKNKNYDENGELNFNAIYLDKPPLKTLPLNDDSDVYLQNDPAKTKGGNNDIEKILTDYNDELTLDDGTSEGFFDNPKEKGDVMKQVSEQNKKEIEDLRHDLGRAMSSHNLENTMSSHNLQGAISSHNADGGNLMFYNKNNFSDLGIDDMTGDKKTVEDLRNKTLMSINSAMINLNKDTVGVRNVLHSQIKEFAANGGKTLLERVNEIKKLTPTSKLYRKHDLQQYYANNMKLLKEKWRKIRERNFDDNDNKAASKKSEDLLSRYFHAVETNEKINKTRQKNSRQQKRQKKIKATLKMINELENQIDKMIIESKGRGDEKTTKKLKKLKKKGKAAIFHELLSGKLKHSDNREKLLANENNEDNSGNDDGDNYLEEGNVEQVEPLNSREINEHLVNMRKHAKSNDESFENDENDIEPPNRNVEILEGVSRKPQVLYQGHGSGEIPSVDQGQLNIMHDIASRDRSVSLEQAETLMDIQKQEVNQDLRKLKEITQDGLQSMFAKAVAKQQKFMDDIQGNTAETRDQLISQPSEQHPYESSVPRVQQQQPIDTTNGEDKFIEIPYTKPRVSQTQPIAKQFLQYRPEDLTGLYSDFGKSRIHGSLIDSAPAVIDDRRDDDDDLVDPEGPDEERDVSDREDVDDSDDNERRLIGT